MPAGRHARRIWRGQYGSVAGRAVFAAVTPDEENASAADRYDYPTSDRGVLRHGVGSDGGPAAPGGIAVSRRSRCGGVVWVRQQSFDRRAGQGVAAPCGPGSRERNPVGFPPYGFDPWRKGWLECRAASVGPRRIPRVPSWPRREPSSLGTDSSVSTTVCDMLVRATSVTEAIHRWHFHVAVDNGRQRNRQYHPQASR